MRIELRDVAKGKRDAALPRVSLAYESGAAALALTETEQRPTVLGLIASGRMKPDAGSVTIDGRADGKRMRAAVALVDAPTVSEPAPDVTLAAVAAEELMFAGLPSHPFAVARQLDVFGAAGLARSAMADLPAAERIRVLCEFALLREGIEALVLVSPDRHGGDPTVWWATAKELADRGLAVLVIAGTAAASAIAAEGLIRVQTAGDAPIAEPAVTVEELFAEEGGPDELAPAPDAPESAAPEPAVTDAPAPTPAPPLHPDDEAGSDAQQNGPAA